MSTRAIQGGAIHITSLCILPTKLETVEPRTYSFYMLNNPQLAQVSNADPTSVTFQGYFTGVSIDFHKRLEQPSMVKVYTRVSSRVSFLHLKYKLPNLAFLSGRLSSSSNLAYLPW